VQDLGGPPKSIDIIQSCPVLFGGIFSCSFLPYSERQDIRLLIILSWLLHKIYLHLFCFGYEIQWLQSYSVPKSVLNKISQNRIHMWKVLFFNLIYVHFYMESSPAGRVCTISQRKCISKITLAWMVNTGIFFLLIMNICISFNVVIYYSVSMWFVFFFLNWGWGLWKLFIIFAINYTKNLWVSYWYVILHVFWLHYTTKCTQRLWSIHVGTFVNQAQHVQDMFWLTHQ